MKLLKVLSLFLVSTSLSAQEIEVTVYNNNQGFIKESREFNFSKGVSEFSFKDIASRIVPTSVLLRGKSWGVSILEQNYRYDLISINKIFEKYLDEKVVIKLDKGKVFEGKLLAIPQENKIVIKSKTGIQIINTEEVITFDFPELPEGLISKPELAWKLYSKQTGKQGIELSYLSSGLNWNAEYVALVNDKDTEMDLTSWVSVNNRSGKTYKDAQLKVIAGSLNQAPSNQFKKFERHEIAMDYLEAGSADFAAKEEPFFEYHLYTIPQKVTLKSNEEKQVTMFSDSKVKTKKIYLFDKSYDTEKPENVDVVLTFKNGKEAGLGVPLPQGRFRIYKKDSKGSNQLIGEDRIEHTAKDEEVKLKVGEAFDIVGERRTKENRRISKRVSEQTIQVSLRNHKEENIEVIVEAGVWGDWEILKSNFQYVKKSASKIEFSIPVKKDGDSTLEYEIRFKN